MKLFSREKKFTDTFGRTIKDGARVYFCGEFPAEQKILDYTFYNLYGVKHPREGVVFIEGDKMFFATVIKGKMQPTGLYWELDGERCYDLTLIRNA